MKKDVYQVVTDRIIGLLEAGTVPWHRPWKGGSQAPQNFMSRKPYRGINLFLLNSAGFASPFWLTFKQIQSLDGRVKKGEKSFPVVFWKIFEEETEGEKKKIPFLRYHSVFNVAQCEGITVPPVVGTKRVFQPIEECERVVNDMTLRPKIELGGDLAYYSPLHDSVRMPIKDCFETVESYYSTLFHELTHATGHVSRLNRKEVTDTIKFGSDPYSREELVAEMGAAFLCGRCEMENTTLNQSASYIQSWLEQLRNDRKLMVHVAAQAQKACDFVLNVRTTEETPVEYQPKEYKVVALKECPVPSELKFCDSADQAASYWRLHISNHPYFNPECECFVVLFLNTRRRVKGHQLLTIGTMDTLLVHPREVFRVAVMCSASAIVIMHNHPSGDPTPSEADVKVTRDLVRAGQLMKIEVLDHVIIGSTTRKSLKEMGYFR